MLAMTWTAVLIDPALERAEHVVLGALSHASDKAYTEAEKLLPGRVIVALVRGDHGTSTCVANKAIRIDKGE